MFKKQILILLIICWSQHSSCFMDDLFKIGQTGWKFITFLNNVKSTKDTSLDFISSITNANENKEVVQKLEGIDQKLGDFQAYTRAKLNHLGALLNTLSDEIEIRSVKSDLVSFILSTNDKWTLLLKYVKEGASRNLYSSLALQIINNIGEHISKFRHNLTPFIRITARDSGFFMLVAQHAHNKRNILCNEGETFHHTLTRLHQIVILTEVKAHVLLSFAYSVTSSKADAKLQFDTLNQNFRNQFVRYNQEYKKSLTSGKLPYLRACDQTQWRRGEDFHELEGYLQQTIYHRPKCISKKHFKCQQLADGKGKNVGCNIVAINDHTKCDSGLYNCMHLRDPFADTDVCVWSEGPYRIRYLQYEGKKLGTDVVKTCPATNYHVSDVSSFWQPPTFCSCQCRSKKWKFVAQLMQSRVDDNYVIVGMRINRIDEFFYIQIAEGKLEANGYISAFSWVPSTRRIHMEWGPNWDMLTVSTDTMHTFFFDDLQLRPGYVLTGVQFAWTSRDEIQGFAIRLLGIEANYQTGKLNLDHRDDPLRTNNAANNELKYTAKNSINMKPYEPSSPDSDGYTHILLRQSELAHDYGQSTLPLFDGVPIMTNPLSPIGGVGFFHKGYEGYAGFLSLRIYPINYVYFMDQFVLAHDLNSLSTWNN